MVCHYLRKNKVKEKIMSKTKRISITLLALVAIISMALMASIPRALSVGGCTVNGQAVPGDPIVIEGTKGDDIIDCRTSTKGHEIYADDGADTVYGSDYDDFIAGGGGNDIEYGEGGNDSIDGGAKDDTIYGGAGDDVIFGGVGSSPASGVGCTLLTEAPGSRMLAKPAMEGGSLLKVLRLYLVRSIVFAKPAMVGRSAPAMIGGSGDDTISGGDGADCINGGSGEDVLNGDAGNDTILGANHGDQINGGLDDDWLDGGAHTDVCTGGGGTDTFVDCETEQ